MSQIHFHWLEKIETIFKLCGEVIDELTKNGINEYFVDKNNKIIKYKVNINKKMINFSFKKHLFCNYCSNSSGFTVPSCNSMIAHFRIFALDYDKHLIESSKNEQMQILFENLNEILVKLTQILEKSSISDENFIAEFQKDYEQYINFKNKYMNDKTNQINEYQIIGKINNTNQIDINK